VFSLTCMPAYFGAVQIKSGIELDVGKWHRIKVVKSLFPHVLKMTVNGSYETTTVVPNASVNDCKFDDENQLMASEAGGMMKNLSITSYPDATVYLTGVGSSPNGLYSFRMNPPLRKGNLKHASGSFEFISKAALGQRSQSNNEETGPWLWEWKRSATEVECTEVLRPRVSRAELSCRRHQAD